MKPEETISTEVTTKEGRVISITMDTYKEPVGKTMDGDFHNIQTFTYKDTNEEIGKLTFPKASKITLERQQEIASNNIEEYLDVISKG